MFLWLGENDIIIGKVVVRGQKQHSRRLFEKPGAYGESDQNTGRLSWHFVSCGSVIKTSMEKGPTESIGCLIDKLQKQHAQILEIFDYGVQTVYRVFLVIHSTNRYSKFEKYLIHFLRPEIQIQFLVSISMQKN